MAQPGRIPSVPTKAPYQPRQGLELEQDALGSVGSQAEEGRPC
jgi:hypothetical protein